MKRRLTCEQLVDEVRALQGEKNKSEYARELGISRQYLEGIYDGLWAPGVKLAKKFGFKRVSRVTMYEELS